MSVQTTHQNPAFTEAMSIILRFEERGQTSAARMLLLADIQKVIEERNEAIGNLPVAMRPAWEHDDGYPV